ncbi:hypothetical protein TNCV_3821001 [Trichonephila clavipes]|nr:hypothetical protein TNCV_3821001 [Trichonephila clavipes]
MGTKITLWDTENAALRRNDQTLRKLSKEQRSISNVYFEQLIVTRNKNYVSSVECKITVNSDRKSNKIDTRVNAYTDGRHFITSQPPAIVHFLEAAVAGHPPLPSKFKASLLHPPVGGIRFLGGQKRRCEVDHAAILDLQLQDARVSVGSTKDADRWQLRRYSHIRLSLNLEL